MSDDKKDKTPQDRLSRRSILGMGSAALAAAGSCWVVHPTFQTPRGVFYA